MRRSTVLSLPLQLVFPVETNEIRDRQGASQEEYRKIEIK
jgi:hypothetical protein